MGVKEVETMQMFEKVAYDVGKIILAVTRDGYKARGSVSFLFLALSFFFFLFVVVFLTKT